MLIGAPRDEALDGRADIPEGYYENGGALRLEDHFGLDPALSAMMPFWKNKSRAFIHASGSPDSSRFHFDAEDYMETATPGIKTTPD